MTRRWPAASALMAAPAALALGVLALTVHTGHTESVWTLLPSTAAIGVIGAFLAGLRPRYVGGWLLLITGVAFLVGQLAEQLVYVGADAGAAPSDLAVEALWVTNWIFPPALVPFFVLVPLTFPDGQLPSRRWRPLAAVAVALGGVLLVVGAYGMPTLMLGAAGQWPNPHYFGFFGSWGATVLGAAQLATLAASLLATASLVVRWRRASDTVRRQILWVVLALGVVCAVLVVDAAVAMLAPEAYPAVFPVIQLVPVVVPVAVAVAVLRFRLFDIEVLVSRAVVYGILTGVLLLTYAAVAAAVTSVLPSAGESAGRLLAAASVAVAFAPLRQWLQQRVGRRLFGARAEPYAALVDLSRELEASSPEQVLATLAASVAQALKVPYAAIQAGWDTGTDPSGEAGRRPPDTANLVEMELTHAGSRVGRLVVAQRSRDAFSAADRRLLSDLARPIAAALQTLRLSMDLQKSRERLVLTVEEERRRLGRDLHDSLGPSLAAISMQVETAAGLVRTDPDAAVRALSNLLDQTEQAVRETRQLSHTHRPPVLDALGLVPALEAHVTHLTTVPVLLSVPEPLPGLPAAVEIAAYRIALEALNNVAAHAHADHCGLRVTHDGRRLVVEVDDDGRGVPDHHRLGMGRASMRERAEELGGTVTVTTGRSGRGTMVRALLPCRPGVTPADPSASGRLRDPTQEGLPWIA